MKVHLVQLDIAWEDKQTNHQRVRTLVEEVSPSPGDLIVLPELFDVGFTLNTQAAIDHDAGTLRFLQELANDTACIIHGARAVPGPDGEHALNCATICAPNDEHPPICEYHKVHPFSYGRETESYAGGDTLKHYPWGELQVCPAVCYDLRFPELFRMGIKAGAHAFVLGANWPSQRQLHWRTLSIARAIENLSFVLAVNRCGNDPFLPYSGGSIAIDPKGNILGELGDEEGVLSVEIEPSVLHDWRKTFPALQDIKMI
ncbi:MAG: nitrilase-related carbon-nitrogen hydrolase [Phycisphaerales bacterium JB052]